MSTDEPTEQPNRTGPRERARRRLAAAESRFYRDHWTQALVHRLKAVDVVNATTLFGSALLLSALPLIIVLSSIADERVDDDISRHIGLNGQGSHIVETLFRSKPSDDAGPIILAVILGVGGTMAAVGFLAEIYERIFALEHRGWRDWWRFAIWTAAAIGALVAEGAGGKALADWAGVPVRIVVTFFAVGGFFHWTMWFLLAGRLSWRALFRPALVTGLLWIGFAVASSLLFSSTLVSDSKLYGKIGVMFTFVTWFVAVGIVIVLGAVGGAVWNDSRAADDSVRDMPQT